MKPGPLTVGDLIDYLKKRDNKTLEEMRDYVIMVGVNDDYRNFEHVTLFNDWPRVNDPAHGYPGTIRLDGHMPDGIGFRRKKT